MVTFKFLMLLIRTKLPLFIFVMLMLFFLVSGCILRWIFFCEGVILGCFEYGNSLFFSKLFSHEWLFRIPPQSEGQCWLVYFNDKFCVWNSFIVNVHQFHTPFYFTDCSCFCGHHLMQVTYQVIAFLYLTTTLSWIDDSFAWCIRYTRRLCNKNMKSLALTE